ncbi:MAG: tetratricopeptide repeat protein, partial [Thermoanaerobaculaceae bacterium]
MKSAVESVPRWASHRWWHVGAHRGDLLVLLVASGVRLWHFLELSASPFGQRLVGDAEVYHGWAQAILAGDWLSRSQGVFYQSPLYPYFLAFLYWLFTPSPTVVFAFQAVLGVAACLLLARTGRLLFSPFAGTLAGLGLALFGPAVFFEGVVQKTALDTFLLCSIFFLWAWLRPHFSLGKLAALGVLLACLAINRENALVVFGIFFLWVWWQSRGRRQMVVLAAFFMAFALPLLALAARNALVGGEWQLTTAQFGPNFYIGNHWRASGMYEPLVPGRGNPQFERADAKALAEKALGRRLTDGEVSRFWAGKAWEFIRDAPGQWLVLLGKKLLLLVNGVEIADTDDFYGRRHYIVSLKVAFLTFSWVLVAAAVGLFQVRAKLKELWVLVVYLAGYALSVAGFFVFARYRFPLVPVLLLFGGAGLEAGMRRKLTWGALAAGAGALVLSLLPLVDRKMQQASSELFLGDFYWSQGRDLGQAIQHYRQAVGLWPPYAEAWLRLAQALTEKGIWREADAAFSQAQRLAPTWDTVEQQWGAMWLRAGDLNRGRLHILKSLEMNPENGESLRLLGDLLFRQGQVERAVDVYRKAEQVLPQSAVVQNNLGAALARLGRWGEAEASLRRACQLDPSYAQPWVNLAKASLAQGRREEAMVALEKALTLDANHPEARELKARIGP